jgi:hypothetical protein
VKKKCVTKVTHVENELVLCCTQTYINAKVLEQINALLNEEINWTSLLQTAASHKTLQLLYWSLKNTCPGAVPEEIMAQLKGCFQNTAEKGNILGQVEYARENFRSGCVSVS